MFAHDGIIFAERQLFRLGARILLGDVKETRVSRADELDLDCGRLCHDLKPYPDERESHETRANKARPLAGSAFNVNPISPILAIHIYLTKLSKIGHSTTGGLSHMGVNQDGLLTLRAQLASQLDQMSEHASQLPLAQLVSEVDSFRRTARDMGFAAAADLAHGLETALARSGGKITIQPFVDTMRDAIGCDSVDPNQMEALLAMASRRLYG
jgi:hypothetical protein